MGKYCPKCGKESREGDKFCKFCGAPLEGGEVGVEKREEDKIYGPWMRGISIFFAVLCLLGATVGWGWYFESGLPLVFFCEFFGLLISISLLLLGLFPDNLCKRLGIDTKDKYMAAVIILIVVWFILTGIEPEPPVGWWNY